MPLDEQVSALSPDTWDLPDEVTNGPEELYGRYSTSAGQPKNTDFVVRITSSNGVSKEVTVPIVTYSAPYIPTVFTRGRRVPRSSTNPRSYWEYAIRFLPELDESSSGLFSIRIKIAFADLNEFIILDEAEYDGDWLIFKKVESSVDDPLNIELQPMKTEITDSNGVNGRGRDTRFVNEI